MDQCIVYKQDDNSIAIIFPCVAIETAIKDIPENVEYKVINTSTLPEDRTFRDAWVLNGNVSVDMTKAVEIKKDMIRAERASKLDALDVEFMRAVETGDTAKQAEISAQKQALRDATDHPALLSATTPEELKAVNPFG